ncbi:hypothetical protein JCM15765_08750 [Paradesulfitobacterium aromaticivorans]
MQRETPPANLKALEMYLAELEKLQGKAIAKRAKEIAKIEKRTAVLSDYETEDEIQEAYGWEAITAKERDQLMDDLKAAKAAGQSALDEPTMLTEYLRMLRNDIRQMVTEIAELKEEETS